jgi:dipeptidyl aminopeptidase/acylaminoacyl peptidase
MYSCNWKGEVKQLTEDWADWTSLQLANDGKRIVATRQSLSTPTDIYMVTPGKNVEKTKIEQISFENKHILDQLTFGKMQQYWVPTTDGKKELVWVMLPANYEEGKKYPTLLFCEGGPQSPVSQFWSYRWNFQIMAANGYVVVAPNRHGLPGFGQEWKEEISGDWTGQCMDDYLSAIDFAADSLPFVDRNKLGAVGASFGGFSVYYLAGHHNKRFKAFIAHDGAFNLESMYTDTEEVFFSNWEYDDAYWNKNRTSRAAKTYENSPHKFVDKWDTPILCIHGEKDYRIVYNQGMGAFNAARLRGIPAELLIFPDENHWVLKPQNGILWQRTFFNWLDRWLK